MAYQFLKKDSEKTAFKKIKNSVKMQDEDYLYATQFFTDKYMVKYLVDEALSGYSQKVLKDIVIIDCAAGGGNFFQTIPLKNFTGVIKNHLKLDK